jgi:hypothetical protein
MKPATALEQIVIGQMMYSGIIPYSGIFQINEYHLQSYITHYGNIAGKTNKGTHKNSNTRYARRLAGLNLLKLNFQRDAKFHDMKSGMIYLIENIVYPDHYKIGMTIDLPSRLNSYQTYDPLRRFKVLKYEFVLDRITAEKKILHHPEIFKETGEWIKRDNAIEMFEKIIFKKNLDL